MNKRTNFPIIPKGILLLLLSFILISANPLTTQKIISIGTVTNEIRMGPIAGNKSITHGVRSILDELLMELDYDLSDTSLKKINVKLVFFDIKNIGRSIGFYHKDVSLTQIIAIGELQIGTKITKRTVKKGTSRQISTSTLVIASDGTFNQQTANIALKKVLAKIVEELLQ